MIEPELSDYQEANRLSRMAAFVWDLRQDILRYDEMMTELLQRVLPTENFSRVLAAPRLVHPKDRAEFCRQLGLMFGGSNKRQSEREDFQFDFRAYITGRTYVWFHLAVRVRYENGAAVKLTGFLQNTDDKQREKSRLQTAVERDPMTGLYSKTHAAYLAGQMIANQTQNALLVIDMDNFKQVNDKLGHLIGDAVILDVALNLKQTFRQTDILGHIGGNEFMVLMRDVPTTEIVLEKCKALRELLRKSYTHKKETVSVSASIGIAFSPQHGADYKTLFERADAALYQGKKNGKDNQTIYSPNFVERRDNDADSAGEGSAEYQKLTAHPLEYIFHMILKSKDTALAVQIMIEIFAKHFRVHRAYVFWHVNGEYWIKAIFDYAAPGYNTAELAHNAEIRRRMRKMYQKTSYGQFTECSDTQKLSESGGKIFRAKQIRAFLECAVTEEDKFLGCVGFDDCENPREWSRAEHEVLAAFAEILQRFLFGQMYYEKAKRSNIWNF